MFTEAKYGATMAVGIEFEGEIGMRCAEYCQVKFGDVSAKYFRFATAKEDRFGGTDMVVMGIPVDVTVNWDGKNNLVVSSTTVEIGFGVKVCFGLRTGNGRRKFKTPVLVMGFVGEVCRASIAKVADVFAKKVEEVIEAGSDAYWTMCDELGLEGGMA